MVLLTMTPAIVAGLQKIYAERTPTGPFTASDEADDDAASSHGPSELVTEQDKVEECTTEAIISTEGKDLHQISALQSSLNEPSLQDPKVGKPISHLQVLDLSHKLKNSNAIPYHLDILLRGSHVYIPPPPPKPEPTAEYKALMARLRRAAEAREYSQLTSPIPPAETYSKNLPSTSPAFAFASTEAYIETSPDDEMTYADVNRQLTLIFNVLVSIVACSVALWMVSKWWSTPARLALSMGGSVVVALAEVGVYFGYIRKVKEAVKEEKKVMEVKEVVQSWATGPGGEEDESIEDKEVLTLLEEKDKDDVVRRRKKKTAD
jgi:hypothetical protein